MSKKIPTPTKIKLNDQEVERLLETLDENKQKTLTLQEASNWLNVSPEYLSKLLDGGEIDFVESDDNRRIMVVELLRYKLQDDRERKKALDELVWMTKEMGGYRELDEE